MTTLSLRFDNRAVVIQTELPNHDVLSREILTAGRRTARTQRQLAEALVLFPTDSISNIHVEFAPQQDHRFTWTHERQIWFKSGSAVRHTRLRKSANGFDMSLDNFMGAYPLPSHANGVVADRNHLSFVCGLLANKLDKSGLSVSIDFLAADADGVTPIFDCLSPLQPLAAIRVCDGGYFANGCQGGGVFLRNDDDDSVRRSMTIQANRLLATPQVDERRFLFSKLPPELRAKVLSCIVKQPRTIPFKNSTLEAKIQYPRTFSRRCCGDCTQALPEIDRDCRCTGIYSYSSTCRCIILNDPIFLASKQIRHEALGIYFLENRFEITGIDCREDVGKKRFDTTEPGGDGGNVPTRIAFAHLKAVMSNGPQTHLSMVRHLTINASLIPICDRGGGDDGWLGLLDFLSKHMNPAARFQIRASARLRASACLKTMKPTRDRASAIQSRDLDRFQSLAVQFPNLNLRFVASARRVYEPLGDEEDDPNEDEDDDDGGYDSTDDFDSDYDDEEYSDGEDGDFEDIVVLDRWT